MTSMSAPVQGVSESKAAPQVKKKGGIDYSKFDNIEDSDDEKPKESAPTKKETETPHCYNCHKAVSKPLRCSICKKAEYCSAQCQKEDWRYHKRTCTPAAKAKAPEEKPPAQQASEEHEQKRKEEKRKEEEKVVDNDDEGLTWYRHREWKPQEAKKEFKPTQISNEQAQANAEATAKPAAGSAWNKAGTWEEKDVTEMAQQTLKAKLNEELRSIDVGGGSLACEGVDKVEGEASKPVIRGKQRHMFDLTFKVKFVFKWMESNGQGNASGHVEVADFTNDTFTEGVLTPPAVQLSFSDSSKLEAGRRKAVEAALGTGAWPPSAGSLMHAVAAKMELWAKSYQEM